MTHSPELQSSQNLLDQFNSSIIPLTNVLDLVASRGYAESAMVALQAPGIDYGIIIRSMDQEPKTSVHITQVSVAGSDIYPPTFNFRGEYDLPGGLSWKLVSADMSKKPSEDEVLYAAKYLTPVARAWSQVGLAAQIKEIDSGLNSFRSLKAVSVLQHIKSFINTRTAKSV